MDLNPESKYIMQDQIGLVIAKGLSVVYKQQPTNPVDFFAQWLLQESAVRKANLVETQKEKELEALKAKHTKKEEAEQRKEIQASKLQEATANKVSEFQERVENSDDLNDELQALTDHLKEFTNSTAVYVGKVAKPISGISKGLDEECNDTAHLLPDAQE